MNLIDTNKSQLDDLPDDLLVQLTVPLSTIRLTELTVQGVSGVSLFVLTLFIPIESTLNIAYTLPVNHRLVDQAHLCNANGHEASIAEAIYKDATCKCLIKGKGPVYISTWPFLMTNVGIAASRQNQSFQSSKLEVVFYEIARAVESQELRFNSLSKLSVDISLGVDPKKKKIVKIVDQAVTCQVTGLSAYRFGLNGMKTLAHVCGRPIGHQLPDVYDWAQILFHPEIQGLGATIEALNLLAAKFSAPFVFKPTARVVDANRYFHSWFQSTHNVRAGMVEGGHRCETAMRTFYGYKIGQTVPLVPLKDFRPIDANSTLVQPFSVNVIQPDSKHFLISDDVLGRIRDYSEEAQGLRSQVVNPTYKTMWWKIYSQCIKVVKQPKFKVFDGMTTKTFFEHPFEKSVVDDPFTAFIEAIKDVVIDRYFDTEPGKGEMQAVNKVDFVQDVKVLKLQGRNFQGIKDVSIKPPGADT